MPKPVLLQIRNRNIHEACGESDIRLNGEKLATYWDGDAGTGSGFPEAFHVLPNLFSIWDISCLDHSKSEDGERPVEENFIEVARVRIFNQNHGRGERVAFTISYTSSDPPELLQLIPNWMEYSDILAHSELWWSSSLKTTPANSHSESSNSAKAAEVVTTVPSKYSGLQFQFRKFQNFLGSTVNKALSLVCPKHKAFEGTRPVYLENPLTGTHEPAVVHYQGETQTVHAAHDELSTPPTHATDSTLHALPSRSAAPFPPSEPSLFRANKHTGLKIFSLVLILSSVVIWIFLRLRDPRVRAERAALQEERRNKRLYRRAAREHKWRRWFCSWRHRDHRCTPVGTWDEKRARVAQQEGVLEEVMKEDIRKLRNANRVEHSINAAEEGRSIYVYDSDGTRHRSRETLPGYESEGTQPPSYDDQGSDCDEPRVADGFRYIPQEIEDTPDSSVISTSPRTSRDDRDSDYGKDFEPLSLSTPAVNAR